MTNTRSEHLATSADWGTPREQVELARKVLGYFTLDPFSSQRWNDHLIKAERFMGGRFAEDDAFLSPWLLDDLDRPATVLCNPPGDTRGDRVDRVRRAWILLHDYWEAGDIMGGAVYIGFNLDQLISLQKVAPGAPFGTIRRPSPLAFPTIFPDRRPRFLRFNDVGEVVEGDRPTHGGFMTLLPATDKARAKKQIAQWNRLGRLLGAVTRPA